MVGTFSMKNKMSFRKGLSTLPIEIVQLTAKGLENPLLRLY